MKIYLVTPRNPESFWTYDRILRSLGKRAIFPNLSMPTVAGLTPREHEVILCDEQVQDIDLDTDADIVGITGYIVHKERIFELIDAFRSRGKFVVVGGPYASLCPEELKGRVDALFVGEAEETWPRFLRDFAAGRAEAVYYELEKPSLADAPMPRFDLLPVDRYHSMTIQFARGCPFNCEFCDIIVVYGRKPRAKTVSQVMAEIEECRRLGATQIFIVDDNFIGNKKLAKELLAAIGTWQRAHGYPVSFNTEVSLNVSEDDELLELLRAAHFTTIFIGIESPRLESLRETRKTQNTRGALLASVHKIQSYGIQVQAGMIVGFDNDDPSIFEEQFRFIQDARIPISMTGMLQAIPKTPLYARLCTAGRLIAESVGDQFVFTNIIPNAMSRLELYQGYRDLIARLYNYRAYKKRVQAYVLNRGGQVARQVRLTRPSLRILWGIVRDCLLRASPRRQWFTLSLTFSTLLRRPSAIAETLTFVLIHRHFYNYVRDLQRRLDRLIDEVRREIAEIPGPVLESIGVSAPVPPLAAPRD